MLYKEIIKRQSGGSLKDPYNSKITTVASSTSVAQKPMLTKQQASNNQDSSARKLYLERLKAREDKENLKRKGQTQIGNTINDMGTNMLTLTTGFRTPNKDEIELGRQGWEGRTKLIGESTTRHLANELTGGLMNYVGGKVVNKQLNSNATSNSISGSINKKMDKWGDQLIDYIDRKVIYPIQYRKEIPLIKKRAQELLAENTHPESINRMEALGINHEAFNRIKPKITVGPGGSRYMLSDDTINIDIRSDNADLLKGRFPTLTRDAVIDHEIGHRYQTHHIPYLKNTMRAKDEKIELPSLERRPTEIDYLSSYLQYKEGLTGQPLSNRNYFFDRPLEPTAHFMETRRGMIEKGYLKDRYEHINVPLIRKYFKDNPEDRIASFIQPTGMWNFKNLKEIFNKLPIAVPAIGAATTAVQNRKANPE